MRGGQVFYDQNVANAITSEKSYVEYTKQFWPAMKAFNGEVHVIIGTCDFVDLGPDIWPNVIDDLKNGHINIIQNAGHNTWMTGDDKFQQALDKILSSN
jgi:pimeloyl-ACP methyl ester carboxylesterase